MIHARESSQAALFGSASNRDASGLVLPVGRVHEGALAVVAKHAERARGVLFVFVTLAQQAFFRSCDTSMTVDRRRNSGYMIGRQALVKVLLRKLHLCGSGIEPILRRWAGAALLRDPPPATVTLS